MEQEILRANGTYDVLDGWFSRQGVKRPMLVCGRSAERQKIYRYLLEEAPDRLGVEIVRFSDFHPNPLYESVQSGVALFRSRRCDGMIAVGGGSAMDVAKCIKLYTTMEGDGAQGAFLRQTIRPNDIPLLAMPTTAGTGSEATRFAVIYYQGVKQSVTHESSVPGTVLLDADVLKTLPLYHKKATMLDALSHAMESIWSLRSTEESRAWGERAIRGVMAHMDGYLANTDEGNAGMLLAANAAGKAINITQTTAGHAMCYKITSLFGCAHGHAAALCNRVLYPWMVQHMERCADPRGQAHLRGALDLIAAAMGCDGAADGARRFARLFDELGLDVPTATREQFELMKRSVNPERLGNHPIALDMETIDALYHLILNGEEA